MNVHEHKEVRIIVLESGDHSDVIVRRLEKGWIVRFIRGSSLFGLDVEVKTSLSGDEPLKWSAGDDSISVYCEVECKLAGSFKYTFVTNGKDSSSGSGYFLVMPVLTTNGIYLPFHGIACQTHLTKLLGSLPTWLERLRVSKECGYNMIHLTPIHKLGASNSSYSISDHHTLNGTIHTFDRQFSFDDVKEVVDTIERDWNMLVVQDVVWNHAAKDAKWLLEHPECSYNCWNSPHLRPAYIIDRLYHHFGREVGSNKWTNYGIPSTIDSIDHVNVFLNFIISFKYIMLIFRHFILRINLNINIGGATSNCLNNTLTIEQDPEWKRFGCTIDWEVALEVFNIVRNDTLCEDDRLLKCSASFRQHLEKLNIEGEKRAWDILLGGLSAVMGHIEYERVAPHGPKKGAVTVDEPLTTDYFFHMESSSSWEEDECLAFDKEKSKFLFAFNGWVMNDNPLKNFALSHSQRLIQDYIRFPSYIFFFIRKMYCHFQYLLLAAREVRPDLYVFAELFTGSEYLDNIYVNRLGISSLIREAQSAGDSHEQGRLVYRYGGDSVGAMMQKSIRLAPATIANALIFDQSHDNPTPIDTRSIYDLLPTAAVVSMASCAVGSTRGYDELVKHAINVVTENRLYARWEKELKRNSGILEARRILNDLHVKLAKENYTQVFVDQMSSDIIGVTRHNPISHETIVVVTHTVFKKSVNRGRVFLKHIPIGGVLEEILFEMNLEETSEASIENDNVLVGLSNYRVKVFEHITPNSAHMCVVREINKGTIELTEFPSGAVIGFKIRLSDKDQIAVNTIRGIISGRKDFENVYLLIGLIPVLNAIRVNNDLGHPLCTNLREGTWLPEFIVARMNKYSGLKRLSTVFNNVLSHLKNVPYYLRPCYFEAILSYLYRSCRNGLMKKLSPSVTCSSFLRSLALSSVSFMRYVPGASLAPLPTSHMESEFAPSLAAGLPHFATGIWRNWGRDTFIALPGCLLATERFTDAKNIIISFAGSLRHGLIPNLLAEGKARFNCRDAVWFWLLSIVKYVDVVPDGKTILNSAVQRIYPNDDTEYGQDIKEQKLIEVMCEALDRHFSGINFRERYAGPLIDEHMKDEGFNVNVNVDRNTGFIHGGNRWNCGTWMDKMGSSDKAGNKGEPATPRDGAAVEIQALAYTTLIAFHNWSNNGIIANKGVKAGDASWTWLDWAEKIRTNFGRYFFVDENCSDHFVHRRSIIKDTVGSSHGYTDFQLRCNFTIALAVAPELMDADKAWTALNKAKNHLLGPIGIKTLDPKDWAYNGFYCNDDDSTNKQTAKGWNYHQGPEWVWVAGFYLRARLIIGKRLGGEYWITARKEVQARLGNYYRHIQVAFLKFARSCFFLMISKILRRVTLSIQSTRNLLRPPRNLPYRGIYRTDGETVRKDDVLVCQHTFNYHPGLNVSFIFFLRSIIIYFIGIV
uniref:Glycogen debranching enzyme n=1 Tax=Heterorhabditis bacteriophora TaxID=37862 RepID=A0A1I7XD66_HETBA